jgi:transcriptional regulator with XRE-family HTH domain
MTALGDQIQRARKRASLTVEGLASLADLDPERLGAVDAGHTLATPDEADRVARVFGVSLRDLVAGRAAESPMRMLLREARAEGVSAIEALAETRAIEELGEFQRWVRDAAELEGLVKATRRALPTALHGDRERKAKHLRLQEGDLVGPIPSMRAFAVALGVRLFFTSPEHLHAQIDGASALDPRPAILVNLVRGGECWWRTRMTIAHELAHILFDLEGDRRTLFSPHIEEDGPNRTAGRWRLDGGFDDVEAEANKFAACLLAPRDEVRALVRDLAPTSNTAIAAVGERFGVGRRVAINRLRDCCGLSLEDRRRMIEESRGLRWQTRAFDADQVDEGERLRAGALGDLVGEALREGKVDGLRAHELLRVPLHEPLRLLGVSTALCAPVLSPERYVRGVARRYVAMTHCRHDLVDGPVSQMGDIWEVTMMRWRPGDPQGVAERIVVVRGGEVEGERPCGADA